MCRPWAQRADTIYYNGKILTMWNEHPAVTAVAIQGDRFLAVGTGADVLKTSDAHTRKVDLHGRCVVPGLIAGHVHPIMAALSEIDEPVPVFSLNSQDTGVRSHFEVQSSQDVDLEQCLRYVCRKAGGLD